jgi:DNA-binding NtrC family response regulator
MGKPIEKIAGDSMAALMTYPWPGNIRELRNVIERAIVLARGPVLQVKLGHKALRHFPTNDPSIGARKRADVPLPAATFCDFAQRLEVAF